MCVGGCLCRWPSLTPQAHSLSLSLSPCSRAPVIKGTVSPPCTRVLVLFVLSRVALSLVGLYKTRITWMHEHIAFTAVQAAILSKFTLLTNY